MMKYKINIQFYGGRGAASGVSEKGKVYGTEFTTVFQSGNIKYLIANEGNTTFPVETMTKGRVYAIVDSKTNKVKYITYYDDKGKKKKELDLEHYHEIKNKKEKPHVHEGYYHDENGSRRLTTKEKRMVDSVLKTWEYKNTNKR